MSNIFCGFVILHIFSSLALAKLPKTLPLLPPRESGNAVGSMKSRSPWNREIVKTHLTAAVEMGTLMRNDSTSSDILGMQLFIGGRTSLIVPVLIPSLYLKPSLGYFRKKQSEGSVSVLQQVIEGGLNIQYEITNPKDVQWSLGLAGRVDYLISTLNVYSQSNSGNSFRLRAGPSSALQFRISSHLKLTTDLECTFTISRPSRVFGGLTTGLAFDL